MPQINNIMKRIFPITFLFILLSGCNLGESPSPSPSPVAPQNNIATLSWTAPNTNTDGTPLTNLIKYNLYYSQNYNTITNSTPTAIAAPSTSAELDNLAAGTWYFQVTAVNSSGVESAPSNMVSKTF